jgi:hypothetical protein
MTVSCLVRKVGICGMASVIACGVMRQLKCVMYAVCCLSLGQHMHKSTVSKDNYKHKLNTK